MHCSSCPRMFVRPQCILSTRQYIMDEYIIFFSFSFELRDLANDPEQLGFAPICYATFKEGSGQ